MKMKAQMFAQMRAAVKNLMEKKGIDPAAVIEQALSGLKVGPLARQGMPPKTPFQTPPHNPFQAQPPAQPAMRDINPPPAGAGAARNASQDGAARDGAARANATPSGTNNGAHQASSGDAQPGADHLRNAQQFAEDFAQDFMSRLGVPNNFNLNLNPNGFDLPGFGGRAAAPAAELKEGAQFISGSFSNHAGSRDYKLYIPSSYHGQAMPLVVMLHGCTQNPDDFAAGTQMNAVAEEKQCFVVYPAQTQQANSSKCWNWFNAIDQQRGQGEPSIIAGIAQQIIEQYPVDERKVYVAGLSAGGAMAAIVGTLYPELFAAVGVHSGLPFASAKDLPSALAAMRGGAASSHTAPAGGIPIIVFHGDRDTTVNPRNGEELIAQGLRSQARGAAAAASIDSGVVPNGHRYTRTSHHHADGTPLGEHWVIHGAGHAWSGGSAHGTYTDGKGPDASREMMRFFKTIV